MKKFPHYEELNSYITNQTGLKNFIRSNEDLKEFQFFIKNFLKNNKKIKDYGEFQTPIHLTNEICCYFKNKNYNPQIIFEPTCGEGNFIISAIEYFPSLNYVYCVDLQGKNEWIFKLKLIKLAFERDLNLEIEFYRDNIFSHKLRKGFEEDIAKSNNKLLILGNPPWITNSELSILNSKNLPKKKNIKNVRGIDAITGKGNFDISEAIILNVIQKFSTVKSKMAMICKTSVIKNIIKAIPNLNLQVSENKVFPIDANKEFKINANAGIFVTNLGSGQDISCLVGSFNEKNEIFKEFGYIGNVFVSNFENYKNYQHLEGKSKYEWRQGVKHDASKIMVLKSITNGKYVNGLNEEIIIEDEYLYPFLKGSMLKSPILNNNSIKHLIIMTQATLNQDPEIIALKNPKLWFYLNSHSKYLDNRKSIVYKDRPRFSIFGVGDYAFKPYKIGISGFNKNPKFCLIFPIKNKPVMLDDTSYYLSFESFNAAFYIWILLNSEDVRNFLLSIAFLDSKRPFNKGNLMRIEIQKYLKLITFENVLEIYNKNLKDYFVFDLEKNDFLNFKNKEILN
ncbi:MAG: hypothetical protein EAX96_16760 [Candidatus Lokiarchaeota archaeon]|nr:hypothetical protein [Candidatus Lokiarchaeota archaeon]